jgi:hypothetical protein
MPARRAPTRESSLPATVHFAFDRSTRGALRYQEVNDAGQPIRTDADGAMVGTLYLRKAKLAGAIPRRITVTIDAG